MIRRTAVVAAALAATALAATICATSPPSPQKQGSGSARPPGSLCAGFPIGGPVGITCGTLEHLSGSLSTFPVWRYTEKPLIQRVSAGRLSLDGVLVASDEDVGAMKDHYRFAFLNPGATLNWRHVATSLAGAGRTLTFEGRDRYSTYRMEFSLRQLSGERVEVRAHVDAALRPRSSEGRPTGSG